MKVFWQENQTTQKHLVDILPKSAVPKHRCLPGKETEEGFERIELEFADG